MRHNYPEVHQQDYRHRQHQSHHSRTKSDTQTLENFGRHFASTVHDKLEAVDHVRTKDSGKSLVVNMEALESISSQLKTAETTKGHDPSSLKKLHGFFESLIGQIKPQSAKASLYGSNRPSFLESDQFKDAASTVTAERKKVILRSPSQSKAIRHVKSKSITFSSSQSKKDKEPAGKGKKEKKAKVSEPIDDESYPKNSRKILKTVKNPTTLKECEAFLELENLRAEYLGSDDSKFTQDTVVDISRENDRIESFQKKGGGAGKGKASHSKEEMTRTPSSASLSAKAKQSKKQKQKSHGSGKDMVLLF
eukprot:CAMPEP_0115031748 /NCGR_PEP_ID=MMETSP0216-20121206/38737_1 /TAXON_ID=223996 /ORGANISM="Protocruzia adherens, Strain Boccale" /LENGTH=306 /DNA_ID=CAMNT_0002409495 /DNA_START=34 /DNA_END=954 /DNA_ORIENTATION=-